MRGWTLPASPSSQDSEQPELLDGYRRGAFTPVEALDAIVTQIEASES